MLEKTIKELEKLEFRRHQASDKNAIALTKISDSSISCGNTKWKVITEITLPELKDNSKVLCAIRSMVFSEKDGWATAFFSPLEVYITLPIPLRKMRLKLSRTLVAKLTACAKKIAAMHQALCSAPNHRACSYAGKFWSAKLYKELYAEINPAQPGA